MTVPFRASFLPLTFALFLTPCVEAQAKSAVPPASATQSAPDRAASYYHYGLAKIYEQQFLANGRQDLATQAIEQYKQAMIADPDSPQLQDGIAMLYFRLGRIREAVTAAQDQVKKHPDDADAHLLLGRVYLRSLDDRSSQGAQTQEMLQAAIKEYETITRLKPTDLESRLLLGQLYALNHESGKAEAEFAAAQKIDPTSEDVVLRMAQMYSEQGNMAKAAKTIADVPAEDRTPRMNFALGNLYDQLKQPKEAAKAYGAAVAQDPENTDARRGLASALQASGQMDAAAKVYGQILGSDPQDAQSLIREADIQRQQGHYEQALTTLKKAESLVPDSNLELDYNEALTYDALGRFEDAVRTLKAAVTATTSKTGKYEDSDRSNRALFLDRLALVYREEGNFDEAVASYKLMEALGGEYQARGAEGEVDALRDAHRWQAALDVATAAAKALPDNHDVQLTYARQLADNGKLDEALKVAQGLMKGTPDDRDVLVTIADMQSRNKHYKQADEALDKADALAQKPEEKLFIHYFRGSIDEREKMYDQAEEEFRKALAIDGDNAATENDYGYMLAERGVKLDQAKTMLEKAVHFDPQNGAYLDSLAWVYYRQGNYSAAEDTERKAVLRQPADPSILAHMGEIYAHNGKLSLAVTEWEKAVSQYATSLPPEADPADVGKTQKDLETARVRLAHAGSGPAK